jgi:hypothetical protein
MVADAIRGSLPGDTPLKLLEEVDHAGDYDLILVRFPVMQFGPPALVKKKAALFAGRKIALFITHALATDSDDPELSAMLQKEIARCRSVFSGSDVVGVFHCQGELAEQTAHELINSGIPALAEFGSMRPLTTGHPTEEELNRARAFATELVARRVQGF